MRFLLIWWIVVGILILIPVWTRKTFMAHQTFIRWALYILFKFGNLSSESSDISMHFSVSDDFREQCHSMTYFPMISFHFLSDMIFNLKVCTVTTNKCYKCNWVSHSQNSVPQIFTIMKIRVPTRSLFPGKVLTFNHGSLGPGKVLSFSNSSKRSWKSPYFLIKSRLMNRCLM